MTQDTLLAGAAAPAASAPHADAGFELGWDHAHHAVVPPPEHLHPLSPVRQGWQAGRECFGRRTLGADAGVRRWLQLRLHAWRCGHWFDAAYVNPAFLRRIDVGHCPVTREALSRDTHPASDASIERVNDDAGYVVGNLAVLSRLAGAARERLGADAVRRAMRQAEGCASPSDGLTAGQWRRLAVLCAFATPLPHRFAALLPLLVLPPPRLRVLNASQSLQVMLSLQVSQDGHASRCAALAAHLSDAETRHAFHGFMHTLLARRLALGRIADRDAERRAVEDLWQDALLNQRWQRLVLRLSAAQCEALVQWAVERGLAGRGLRWLAPSVATEGWALQAGGPAAAAATAAQSAPLANCTHERCAQPATVSPRAACPSAANA